MALLVVAVGSIEAFISGLRAMLAQSAAAYSARIWLRLARWLIAGLTFQLAADVVGTTVAPTWDELGRLAAIAAIRTFLSLFLERDMAEYRQMSAVTTKESVQANSRPN